MSETYVDGTTPLNAAHMNALQQKVEKGVANGYCELDSGVLVPIARLPSLAGTYQVRTEKAAVNGYASLDGTGKVPLAQLPPITQPGMVQIADVVLASAAAQIDFTSIPQTYLHLKVIFQGRSDAAGTDQNLQMRFNSDAGTNYNWQFVRGSLTAVTANTGASQTYFYVGLVSNAGTGAANGAITEITIPGYSGTQWYKHMMCQNTQLHSAFYYHSVGGHWLSTAAITAIRLFPASGNFNTGSRATLYGMT